MPTYRIQHITKYVYSAPVIDNINQIKIYPFHTDDQNIIRQEVLITGDPLINFYIDYFGNRVGVFSITEPLYEVVINSKLTVHKDIPEKKLMKPLPAIIRLDYTTPNVIQSGHLIRDILSQCPHRTDIRRIVEWCSVYVYENIQYQKGVTTIETTVDDILTYKKGVCQDFAHLLLQLLRTKGITCRYVSGYICPNKNGMRGEGATHAWIEAWVDEYGWEGIDPTNNVWVTDTHVKLAVGRDFNDCSPVKGAFKGLANQTMSVYVSVGFEDGHMVEDNNMVAMPEQFTNQPLPAPDNAMQQQQ